MNAPDTIRVAIFDYGAGNLHSLGKALAAPGISVTIETDAARAANADVLVLPGVGSFGAASVALGADIQLRDAISTGLPTIGVCLGMQLLFETSEEGEGRGLGVLPGRVRRIRARRTPHIGWNSLRDSAGQTLGELPTAYFANSFVCEPADASIVAAWSEQDGDRFPALVRDGNIVGVQFHPEKSSAAGVRFLRDLVSAA